MSIEDYKAENHCLYLKDGKFHPDETNNLDRIFAGFSSSPSNTLVIHFHGGLVDNASGKEVAQKLYKDCYGADSYPVFFVWDSGLLSSLGQTLPRIFQETIFRQLMERVGQFAVGKIEQQQRRQAPGARSGNTPLVPVSKFYVKGELKKAESGSEPFADKDPSVVPPEETLQPTEETEFYKSLLRDPELPKEAAKIANGLRTGDASAPDGTARGDAVQGVSTTLMSPDVLAEMRVEDEGSTRGVLSSAAVLARLALGGARVLKCVIDRFAKRRDHGVQATIVEEILREFYLGNVGRSVWDTMKQDTRDAFNQDSTIYGGTAFVERLKALWDEGKAPQRIVLIGHSTGAVYICHFLKAANVMLPPEATFDVVFLAPACDFKLLADTLHRYEDRIAHFRSFGMHDDIEKSELLLDFDQLNAVPVVKKLYPGSLLFFVSGVLEAESDWPLVGMERFYQKRATYDEQTADYIEDVRAYFSSVANSCVWSDDNGGDGLASTSHHHGDFDNDSTTLKSLGYLIKNGF